MITPGYIMRHLTPNGATTYPLRERLLLVGASADNDIVLTGTTAPLLFKCEPCPEGYRCTIASKETLLVNEKKVKTSVLAPGDTISVGNETFVFDRASVTPPAAPQTRLPDKLQRFVEAIGRERQLQPLLQRMMRILLELTGGTDIFIFKLDPDGRPEIFESNCRGDSDDRFSDTVVRGVLERKVGICIPNALADPAYKNAHSIADLKLRSVLCAPMLSAGKCTGLIYIGSGNPAVSFTEEDLDTVGVYAAIAAMLINHVDFIATQQETIDRFTGAVDHPGLVVSSPVMRRVVGEVEAVASADIAVLLEGETGTGKNRIAELIHARSRRSSGPFVVVNCSALHGELLESELFGHRRGSFTGATADHDGLFAAAHGGTLLLDEIGELGVALQAKLLRTLETGTVRPIGANREISVDVRVLCATNRDLGAMVAAGGFRTDLYYRINQFSIVIPPLRERGEDIVLIALLLLNRYKNECPGGAPVGFHPETLRYIRNHSWPGNIRELSNAVRRAVLMCTGPLVRFEASSQIASEPADFEAACRLFQKSLLEKAIAEAEGNKELAARNLGLSRSTFYRYLSQFGE